MAGHEAILPFAFSVLAGGVNNVTAGAAGFTIFALLLAAGMTEVEASASNFVAVLPANLAGTWVYRREPTTAGRNLGMRLGMSAVGGLIGLLIRIHTGQASFQSAIPCLLPFATISLAITPCINTWVRAVPGYDREKWLWLSLCLKF